MNTIQLNRFLINDTFISNYGYRGIYFSNTLPQGRRPKGIYVVNTSPSYIPVGHWTAIIDETFFCSYGSKPSDFGIENITRCNHLPLQAMNSSVCGFYVIMFLKVAARGYTMEESLECFTDNHEVNDNIISHLSLLL